jgi:hypothetical protein
MRKGVLLSFGSPTAPTHAIPQFPRPSLASWPSAEVETDALSQSTKAETAGFNRTHKSTPCATTAATAGGLL